jgi:pimeloyl-ACP methyl ester carboxylesterase
MISSWTEQYVTVNGAQFHYHRTGDGSQPALVLAHGFSDNGMCWLPVARDLEAEYDVVLPDARGHGRSPRVQPGEQVDHAADLAGIIQALGLDRPVVGGHSMGASTASALAAARPELVRALILEDPGWRDPQPEPKPGAEKEPQPNPWFEWLHTLPNLSLEEVIAKGRADSPTWPEIEFGPWAESKKQLDLNILQTVPVHRAWREVAQAIACPTLLITSDSNQGGIVTPQMARTAILLNRRIQMANIAGVGHNIRREDYQGYMRAVREFLASL